MGKKSLCILLLGLFVSFNELQESKAVDCSGGHQNGERWIEQQGPQQCKDCMCSDDKPECQSMECEYEFNCQKYTPFMPGKCCSAKCACHHDGVDKVDGEEWADRRTSGKCLQCQCHGGEASCTDTKCYENCENPEYIPGQCCPRCSPKAPVTVPWETLPPTSAFPQFPFRPRPPGRGKRRIKWKSKQ